MTKDPFLAGIENHDSYEQALAANGVRFDDAVIPEEKPAKFDNLVVVNELEEAHKVPEDLKELPFIDLAMFLHYQLDGVPPGELTPQMLSAWIETHKRYCEEKSRITLQYQAMPMIDNTRVMELMVEWADRHIAQNKEFDRKNPNEPFEISPIKFDPIIENKEKNNIDKGL